LVIEPNTGLISEYGFQSTFDPSQLDVETSFSMIPGIVVAGW
jgi:hypothetical protein